MSEVPLCADSRLNTTRTFLGAGGRPVSVDGRVAVYLTESVYKVVLQMSISAHIRQLILHMSNNKEYVDEFVRESTFAKRVYKHFL